MFFDPLVHQELGVHGALHARDGLHPPGHHHRNLVHDHPLRSQGNGLQARGTLPVNGGATRRDWQASPQGSVAADVVAGGPLLQGAAHHHVFHFCRVDACALDRMRNGVPGQGGAVGHVKAAAPGLAQRRAGGRYDYCVGHKYSLNSRFS